MKRKWFNAAMGIMAVVGIALCGRADSAKALDEIPFVHKVLDEKGPRDPWVKMVGDLDGDGFPDVIIAGRQGPVVWYAWPKWTQTVIGPEATGVVDGELGDVDRDGDLDVIMGGIVWYENPLPSAKSTQADWKAHRIATHRTHDLEAADLDGDGDLDVVARGQSGFGHKIGNQIHIWRQDSPDKWIERIVACPHGEALTLGDMDKDGDADIVIGGRWYENTKDVLGGPWTEHVFAPDWHPDAVVQTADFNGDARLDAVMAASEAAYRPSWFEAPDDPRSGPWKEHPIDGSVDFAHGIGVADLDNDGDADVVAAEMHQSKRDRVLVYRNEAKGAKWTAQVLATSGSHNLELADIGNDGDVDVVGANWSGPYQPIEMWENLIKGGK